MIATAPLFKFGQAAHVAGVSEKMLRNWLDRRQVSIEDSQFDHQHGKWRQFSFVDVFTLTLIGRLVRYGITVEDADRVALSVIKDGMRRQWRHNRVSHDVVTKYLAEKRIFVGQPNTPDGDIQFSVGPNRIPPEADALPDFLSISLLNLLDGVAQRMGDVVADMKIEVAAIQNNSSRKKKESVSA
ncbi:MAG TPA: MerR family transcriptional regulator [Rhizomicrobium sp.]